MIEMVLMIGVVVSVTVAVKQWVLGGPGSIGYDVMEYFVLQLDSQVSVGAPKAVMGGEPSWNYYYHNQNKAIVGVGSN